MWVLSRTFCSRLGLNLPKTNLTYREEALDSLCVVKGVGLRGGGGGVELQVHLGQRADPLPHLLPCRPRLAGPVEGARNEVSDLVPPPLSLPEQLTVTGLVWLYELNTEYYFKRKSYLTVRYLIISSKSLNVLSSYLLLCSLWAWIVALCCSGLRLERAGATSRTTRKSLERISGPENIHLQLFERNNYMNILQVFMHWGLRFS